MKKLAWNDRREKHDENLVLKVLGRLTSVEEGQGNNQGDDTVREESRKPIVCLAPERSHCSSCYSLHLIYEWCGIFQNSRHRIIVWNGTRFSVDILNLYLVGLKLRRLAVYLA